VGAFLHMYIVARVPTASVLRGLLVPVVPRANIEQVGGRGLGVEVWGLGGLRWTDV